MSIPSLFCILFIYIFIHIHINTIYLHQSAFCVQFLGVLLGLILGTSECTRMLPRLIRSIYSVQANCVTDLGVCCPPLGLVVPSS